MVMCERRIVKFALFHLIVLYSLMQWSAIPYKVPAQQDWSAGQEVMLNLPQY